MIVEKIPVNLSTGVRLPISCAGTVRVAKKPTNATRRHNYHAARLGLPEDACIQKAAFRMDGVCYCSSHAGQRALAFLMGGDDAPKA